VGEKAMDNKNVVFIGNGVGSIVEKKSDVNVTK
jgi:hypothetical protein